MSEWRSPNQEPGTQDSCLLVLLQPQAREVRAPLPLCSRSDWALASGVGHWGALFQPSSAAPSSSLPTGAL